MKNKLIKLVMVSICMFFTIHVQTSAEEKYGSITSISYGGYQTTDGEDTLNGSQLAISFTSYFAEQWSYFIRLSNGNASGTHSENDNTYELKASTTTLTGGIRWSYGFDINSDSQDDLSPFIGTGLSVQKYEYDFDYQGSEVGKTSGTGYGPFVSLGLKIAISSNIVILPGYHYEQITIKTEEGSDHSFTSSGASLAFVARF